MKNPLNHPIFLLAFFTSSYFIIYYDRGVVAGVLSQVEEQFKLTKTQTGIIQGAFIGSYIVAAPLFAHFSHKFRPTRLMTVGLLIWCAASAAGGFANNFWTILVARLFIGAGESSLAGLAPTVIDDLVAVHAPKQRTAWIGIFYTAMPVGVASGYIAAGYITLIASWRWCFFTEAALMVPFAILCWWVNPPEQKRETLSDPHRIGLLSSIAALLKNSTFDLIVLGAAAYTFVIGAIAFWLPDYLVTVIKMTPDKANLGVGVTSFITGFGGTLLGGWILDRFGGSVGNQGISRAMKMCSILTLVALPFGVAGFFFTNPVYIFLCLGCAQMCLFIGQSPMSSAVLSCVPVDLRSMAMALCIFAIHLLGDMPSGTIVGLITDGLKDERLAMIILTSWLLFSVLFWFIAWWRTRNGDPINYESDIEFSPLKNMDDYDDEL